MVLTVYSARRVLLSGGLVGAALLAGCGTLATEPASAPVPAPARVSGAASAQLTAADAAIRQTLAPTGKLRAAAYLGSPSSMVIDAKTGEKVGITISLGRELARRLDVPFELVEHRLVADVVASLKSGAADFTVTNASPARARDIDFTQPIIDLELGYLVLPGAVITSIDAVDRPGMRIGVSQGSSSQGALTRVYKNASVVPVTSLKMGAQWLIEKKLDAFATNKAVLSQMMDELPGARLLDGRWGVEHIGIAIPKGRDAALPYLKQFAAEVQSNGQLAAAVVRAGLRGTAAPGVQ